MTDEIMTLIKQYELPGDFNYANVTDEMIEKAQESLGVKLPDQFISFVKTFGYGGIGGITILGVGLDGTIMFEEDTLQYREFGLPKNLVVVENIDEWLNCIDCCDGRIVSWDSSGLIKEECEDFDSYLLRQIRDAVDNL